MMMVMLKKHLGRGNLMYCFQICFQISESEYPIVSMLKQNSCHKVHASYKYIYLLFHCHIISNLFVSRQIKGKILWQKFSIANHLPL